jgi:hypothetical protein
LGPAVLLQAYRYISLLKKDNLFWKLFFIYSLYSFWKDGSLTREMNSTRRDCRNSRTPSRSTDATPSWTAPKFARRLASFFHLSQFLSLKLYFNEFN